MINRIAMVLLGLLVIIVVGLGVFKFKHEPKAAPDVNAQLTPGNPVGTSEDSDTALKANRDNYINTLTTLVTKLDTQENELKNLKAQISAADSKGVNGAQTSPEMLALKQKLINMETNVAQLVDAVRAEKTTPVAETAKVTGGLNPVEPVSPATVKSTESAPKTSPVGITTGGPGNSDGLGLDGLLHTNTDAPRTRFNDSQKPAFNRAADLLSAGSDGYVTLVSLNSGVNAALKNAHRADAFGMLSSAGDNATAAASAAQSATPGLLATGSTDANKKPPSIPIYTIEDTATLMDNTNLTAIFGDVPEKGGVANPYRFKIITGSDNLASNGLTMPYIKNIVWSGYAYGNREMSCVSGNLDKVTYTFSDNTIHTYRSKTKSKNKMEIGLGYLSDRQGNPCIPGIFISNAQQYLRDRVVVAGAVAAADAAAAAQTNTTSNPLQTTTVVTNKANFIASEMTVGTLKELGAYLKDRMDTAIDIVILPPGKDLTLHVEEEIPIDYDPTGRKLIHASATAFNAKNAPRRLD